MKNERMPKPFDSFVVSTGYEAEIEQKTDRFFERVIRFLKFDDEAIRRMVNRDVRNVAIINPSVPGGVQITEDMISLLEVGERCVASVTKRRDGYNYVEVLAACYLDPERVAILRDMAKGKTD